MQRILNIILLLFALITAPQVLTAQNFSSHKGDITEGDLMVTILSDQIIRVQQSETREFAETNIPEHLAMELPVKVARHEDRLMIESVFFSLTHIPQKGISPNNSPWITSPYKSHKLFPLAAKQIISDDFNRGVLIIDNLKEKIFPITAHVQADRIIVFTDNSFADQLGLLQSISGKKVNVPEACTTPQVYFKPVKGSAMLQIESSPDATIFFTRDGTTPTYNSEVYKKSQLLKSSARVVAFATDDKHIPSAIAEAQIVMSKAREIEWRHDYSPEYCGLGEYALMDGLKGDSENYNRNWIGIPNNDMSVEIELNRPMALSMLGVRFFQQPDKGIFIPERVVIEVSCDGRRFHKIYRHRIKVPDAPYNHWTHAITARFKAREVKYIRIYGEANDKIKSQEHFLEGEKWIFVDEITYEQQPDREGLGACREKK